MQGTHSRWEQRRLSDAGACVVGAEGQCVPRAGVWDEVAARISRRDPRPAVTMPASLWVHAECHF